MAINQSKYSMKQGVIKAASFSPCLLRAIIKAVGANSIQFRRTENKHGNGKLIKGAEIRAADGANKWATARHHASRREVECSNYVTYYIEYIHMYIIG